jgi:hypothetical protein
MKKSQQSPLRRFAVNALVIIASAGTAVTAQAAYIATATEIGGDVVLEGSGSIDLTAMTSNCLNCATITGVRPSSYILLGPSDGRTDVYDTASLTGPAAIGTGTATFQGSTPPGGTGGFTGIGWASSPRIYVPAGYVSEALIAASATITGETFASIGLTPGSYEWTWGSGASADSFTLNVGAVPIPAAVWLFGSGLVGLVGMARRKKA